MCVYTYVRARVYVCVLCACVHACVYVKVPKVVGSVELMTPPRGRSVISAVFTVAKVEVTQLPNNKECAPPTLKRAREPPLFGQRAGRARGGLQTRPLLLVQGLHPSAAAGTHRGSTRL